MPGPLATAAIGNAPQIGQVGAAAADAGGGRLKKWGQKGSLAQRYLNPAKFAARLYGRRFELGARNFVKRFGVNSRFGRAWTTVADALKLRTAAGIDYGKYVDKGTAAISNKLATPEMQKILDTQKTKADKSRNLTGRVAAGIATRRVSAGRVATPQIPTRKPAGPRGLPDKSAPRRGVTPVTTGRARVGRPSVGLGRPGEQRSGARPGVTGPQR